ncbi:hypothetical protein FRC04_010854 [Tulasnella sp. 424]|nr:hypothetical protein FRC04_010854 [Tulasnella sp. 424]KAG8972008.1 hypothetical protein FRC05_010421 [Tulasnella sp. 425]
MDTEKVDEMINALYGEAKNIRNDIKEWEKGDCPKTILCRCLKKTLERSEAVLLKLSSDIPLLVAPESTEMIRILKDRITLAKGNGQSAEVTRACHELYAIRTNSKLETNAPTSDLGDEVEEIKPCDFNDIFGWSGGEGIWLEREVVTIKTPVSLVHVFRRSRSKAAAGLELLQRFNRQLEQWRALDHPHVLRLYGWYGHGHTA